MKILVTLQAHLDQSSNLLATRSVAHHGPAHPPSSPALCAMPREGVLHTLESKENNNESTTD